LNGGDARRGGGRYRCRDGRRDADNLLVRDEFLLLACEAAEAALRPAGQVGDTSSRGVAASATQRSEQVGGTSSREGVRGAALRHAWNIVTAVPGTTESERRIEERGMTFWMQFYTVGTKTFPRSCPRNGVPGTRNARLFPFPGD
jgi:hypothetical protein